MSALPVELKEPRTPPRRWTCRTCGAVDYLDGCDNPFPIFGDEVQQTGRTNRTLAPALDRINAAVEAGRSPWPEVLTADVWEWLIHDVGEAEQLYGAALYTPPRHTIYLSGVECATTRDNAGRDDLGILVQPATNSYVKKVPAYGRFAADNGCFSKGASFDVEAWKRWVDTVPRDRCLFVTAPDVFDPVAGRGDPVATWERSRTILPWIRSTGHRAALVAQDGMEDLDVDWDAFDCLFVGASTEWKLSASAVTLGERARAHGLWTHVGRVNSYKRLAWAHRVGFDSVDGTFLAYGERANGPKLIAWLDQLNATHDAPSLFDGV